MKIKLVMLIISLAIGFNSFAQIRTNDEILEILAVFDLPGTPLLKDNQYMQLLELHQVADIEYLVSEINSKYSDEKRQEFTLSNGETVELVIKPVKKQADEISYEATELGAGVTFYYSEFCTPYLGRDYIKLVDYGVHEGSPTLPYKGIPANYHKKNGNYFFLLENRDGVTPAPYITGALCCGPLYCNDLYYYDKQGNIYHQEENPNGELGIMQVEKIFLKENQKIEYIASIHKNFLGWWVTRYLISGEFFYRKIKVKY